MALTKEYVLSLLGAVKDPEIPVLSLVDLGIITQLTISETDEVSITITPTFSGCPALDSMKNQLRDELKKNGVVCNEVAVSFETPWNSDKLSEKGRAAIKKFGLAPPPMMGNLHADLDILEQITCPFCDSHDTEMQSMFGATICRSMHYCNSCRQAFEQFKPLG